MKSEIDETICGTYTRGDLRENDVHIALQTPVGILSHRKECIESVGEERRREKRSSEERRAEREEKREVK
jgi:sRNA-binding carbon storage regulator CsrA